MDAPLEPLPKNQAKYLEWLLLTGAQRSALGYPHTQTDYAAHAGVTDRTLRKWRTQPLFESHLAGRQATLADLAEAGRPAASPEQDTPAQPAEPVSLEDSVAAALALLNARIAEGDLKAVEPLLRVPTVKAFLEAQTAALNATFDDLTDEALLTKLLATVTDEELAGELARRKGAA